MKLINQSVEYLPQEDLFKQIELAARTCYSEDTEVLTTNGWKYFKDVTNEDKVLTYVPETNKMIWDTPNIICNEIEDSMVEITHANIKLCITKDHRIYQSAPGRREYNFLKASQIAGIEKIPMSRQCKFRIPKYFIGSKRDTSCIEIPTVKYEANINIGHGRTKIKKLEFKVSEDFMVIAGAYIAEGHTNNHLKWGSGSNCVITQEENTPLYNNVISALNNLKWNYRICKDPRKPQIKWITITGGILWVKMFDDLFGKGSKNKHLPRWFRKLPDEYLQIMLYNMYLGDGTHNKTRKERYLSISKRLLEEVQEVFILLGKNASFTYDSDINQKCSIEESTRDSWIINRKKHITILPPKKRKVYCTSTTSGIIQVRYKDKTCWCGNCYKSEDKITDDSAEKMVDGLIKAGHNAMLEHGTVYLYYPVNCYSIEETAFISKYKNNPYTKIWSRVDDNPWEDGSLHTIMGESPSGDVENCITTNYRVLVENGWLEDLKYQCEPTEYHAKRYTFRLTTSIGIVRELIRHRVFSFANESSRYCDYSNNSKFNEGITFIIPYWLENSNDGAFKTFMDNCRNAEKSYFKLKEDLSAQQAREVLPLCTKSELVMTGFEDDWKRFLDVRLEGTTGKPHPDMVELAKLIKNELEKAKK